MADAHQKGKIKSKIVLLGATAVGKTSIFNRIQTNDYIEDNVTTMAAYFRPKTVDFPEQQVKVEMARAAAAERKKARNQRSLKEVDDDCDPFGWGGGLDAC